MASSSASKIAPRSPLAKAAAMVPGEPPRLLRTCAASDRWRGPSPVLSSFAWITSISPIRDPEAASPSNHDYLRSLGADEIIDYNTVDFTTVVSGVDAVFETAGEDVAMRSFEVVRSGGRVAFIASGPKAPVSPRTDVASLRPAVGRDRPHLERVLELLAAGALRVPEVTVYPLSEAVAAHRVSEARHLKGKLIFQVR